MTSAAYSVAVRVVMVWDVIYTVWLIAFLFGEKQMQSWKATSEKKMRCEAEVLVAALVAAESTASEHNVGLHVTGAIDRTNKRSPPHSSGHYGK